MKAMFSAAVVAAVSLSGVAFAGTTTENISELSVVKLLSDFTGQTFSYNVKGKVLLGSNSCFASGAKAELVTVRSTRRGVLTLAAQVTKPVQNKMCIEIYDPVYADVNFVVNGNWNTIKQIRVLKVADSNNNVTPSVDLIREATVVGASREAINGGIVANGVSLRVNGKVYLGGNSCQRAGLFADMQQSTSLGRLAVTPVVVGLRSSRICPMYVEAPELTFSPVRSDIRTTLSATSSIVVNNVDQEGNTVSVYDLPEAH